MSRIDPRPCAIDLADAAQIENQRAGFRPGCRGNLVDETFAGAEKQCALQLHDQDAVAMLLQCAFISLASRDLRELMAWQR